MDFEVKLISDDSIVCEIRGRLLIDDEVNKILETLEPHIENNIILDLGQLMYISSAGLSLFIRLLTRTRIHNKKIVLVNLQENVEKLFRIAKLNDIFAISDSIENAVTIIKNK